MKTKMRIQSIDQCPYCGHWSGDADVPFVIYTKARGRWLEEAAEMCEQDPGDDQWVEWHNRGKQLTKDWQ